ncbi:MAG: ABC transporter substrate-binding protein [Rickettsia endosymbiont of Bryobia graminum]|nr:ABC transporter substrate-binding protein [Rickettsia endosymbiont of Bryobia graminum]
MKKIIFCLLILSSLSSSVYASDAVYNYANQLVKDELSILNDKNINQPTKVEKTKKLILANLDLNWMAKFTLGNYRKTLQSTQVEAFTSVYSHYVSKAYSDLVKNYHGQEPKDLKVESINEKEHVVSMFIGTVNVKYLIRGVGSFKVYDIITEGVSLINSQQAEFMNILSSRGYDALISDLKAKSL